MSAERGDSKRDLFEDVSDALNYPGGPNVVERPDGVAINPPETGYLCDFCGISPAPNICMARDAVMAVDDATRISEGNWAACNPCTHLVSLGDREALAKRATRIIAKRHDLDPKLVRPNVLKSHSAFWRARIVVGLN